ncbi:MULTISPECIES: AAA family ATPase [Pirellulaceae]|uniref:Pilus assembly protein CpaE n=1 Tax=Aporhodopirellula rubra TaxID=980271 RepID=A0A7W5E0S3_9BACT|nr:MULTISPECIES: AAA family ATPase [Pirellulaceae]EMI43260.1 response regulator receiver protein [Rhodopirellula sp. SWK7]MBB3208005.1 pilus assembly protein CpaE [Aporhodopirellula rubra]
MSNVLRLALVDPNDSSREQLKAMLLGMDSIWLEADCSRYEFFPDIVEQTTPDVGVVSLDSNPVSAINLITRITAECPGTALLAASESSDGQQILKAIRAGAREFLTLPLNDQELSEALDRISMAKFGGGDSRNRSCEVIAVAGATGGVGSTSTAVNLGCVLAEEPRNSVALVDLDIALGDADVFLDAIPDYTLADVVQNISRLDIQLLKRSLTKHSSGLYLLPRPVELHDVAGIDSESLRKVIGLLKASFTHLIIDLSKTYNDLDMVAIEAASRVMLITQLDLPCLRNVVRLMMSFDETEGLQDKVDIIVNRAGLDAGQISLKKAKETLGRDIFALLPNDYRTMVEVRNNGVPLITQAPKAALTQAFRDMATRIGGDHGGEAQPDPQESDAGAANESRWKRFWPGQTKAKS